MLRKIRHRDKRYKRSIRLKKRRDDAFIEFYGIDSLDLSH